MTDRIALIADIHGNLPAYRAISADLKNLNIDKTIIAGDMITDCPDSDEILNLVRRSDCFVIKGNREQYFLDHRAGLKDHWTHSRQMSALMWSFDRLSSANRRFLKKLHDQTVVTVQGLNLRVVHGSPDSIGELIYPIEKRSRFEQIMSNLKEDVLICGHSHRQWNCSFRGKTAVNPGAAGVHFNRQSGAEYSILTIKDGIVTVEHRCVSYSLEELEQRFRESGLYEASPHWSQSVLDSIRKGENLSMKMIDSALELMDREGIKEALTIPDHIWDRIGEEYMINRD